MQVADTAVSVGEPDYFDRSGAKTVVQDQS